MFPLLETRGIPRDGGPLGVMFREHERSRAYLLRMQKAAHQRDHVGFALAAEEYAHLLRRHIFKENYLLFQMAESRLTEEDDADLLEKFLIVEHDQGGDDALKRLGDEIKLWEEKFREPTRHQ